MLVTYTGWGFYQYEVDTDNLNLTAEEKKEGRFSGVCRERDEYVDRLIFELPKHLEQELRTRGETVVDYLLFTEGGYYKDMCQNLQLPPKANTERFYLCEDEEPANNDSWIHERKRKQVRYTIQNTFEAGNQRELLSSVASIPDQQAVDVKKVSAPKKVGIKKTRRQEQIPLLLSVIDELKHDRLNIPVGEKQTILQKCLESKVFTSESVFERVWSELSTSGKIAIADKEKYLPIQ